MQTCRDAVTALRQAMQTQISGELTFPTSLDASRRVLRAVENPDIGLAALAKIVVAEPLLSAKVIRLANSVALNPVGQTVSDVRHAVLRVGMNQIKSMAMALLLEQLRQTQRHVACRDIANRLWERSVHVAALAYVLARKLTKLDADEAMFAGIVHDLGRFYLLARAAEYPELIANTQLLAETINDLASEASERVLEALSLPTGVIGAVRASRAFSGTLPPSTLGDVLYIARAVSPRENPLETLDGRSEPVDNPADVLGLGDDMIHELIAASGDEIYSIVVALEA